MVKNKSVLLISFFLISGVFQVLNMANIVPNIEDNSLPPGFIEMVNRAESGEELSEEGKSQAEEYRENMELFLERHENDK